MNFHDYDKPTIEAVKKVSPAVVSIVISKHLPKMKSIFQSPFILPFGAPDGADREKVRVGGGSGFVVNPDGIVLTNKHVVFDTEAEYVVVGADNSEYPAKVISRDPVNDIAMLKISAKNLPVVELGDSSTLQLGQTVIAIGNALGLFSNSVSKGIVSGLSRSISASLGSGGATERLRGVVQTDVAINQGNSGGPLVNLDGQAVGINTAVIFGAQNIGFSIPINWAKQDLNDVITHGRIIKPYLGVQYVMLTKETVKRYSLPADHGALVMRGHLPDSQAVIPHSPAHKSGLKENDIVLAVNGKELDEQQDLSDLLQQYKVGDHIELSVLRGGDKLNLTVELEERR